MGTGSRELNYLCLIVILFFLVGGASAHADYNDRWRTISQQCLIPQMQDLQCLYEKNNTPLDKSSRLGQLQYEVGYGGLGRFVGWLRQGWSGLGVLTQQEDAQFWQQYEARLGYRSIEGFAVRKANRENLSSCQRACLATCISAHLIDYDDRNVITHRGESIASQRGVCREYAAIAHRLMQKLGLQSKVVVGMSYDRNWFNKQLEAIEGHAMVEVSLGRRSQFIMEPQFDSCVFFDSNFTGEYAEIERFTLNHMK